MVEQENPTPTTTTTRTTARGASPTTPVAGPEEELKKLKEALAKEQGEAEKLKEKIEKSQAKLKDLEKVVAAANQVTGGFAGAVQAIATERLEVQDFITNELPQIEKHPDVKPRVADVKAKTEEVDKAIKDKADEEKALKQKADEENAASKTATDEYAARKLELDSLKDRQRVIQDKFGKIRKTRQRMATEGAKNPVLKYMLAIELKRIWDETKDLFIPTEQLESEYYAKAEEARAAGAAAASQDERTKAAQAELDAVRKDLDARRNNRLEDIIKGVGDAPAPVAVPAGAGATRA
jgi:chromosome segregation ATPase